MVNYKDIQIGSFIQQRVIELGVEESRLCAFIECNEEELKQVYESKSLNSELLLQLSIVLDYDFFRICSQHLLLYSPPASNNNAHLNKSNQLQIRKNIYTKEIIDFILQQISSGKKSRLQIIEEYKIPKTTLQNWINKYKNGTTRL